MSELSQPESDPKLYKQKLRKRMRVMLTIVGILFALIFLIHLVRGVIMKKMLSKFTQQAVTISTSIAQSETWTPTINAVGSLVATDGVEVSPQIAGMVTGIFFQSGQNVAKDQPLVQLDDRTDQQDLKNLNAQLTLSKLNYDRQVSLMKTNATAQSNLDQAAATLQESQAAVTKTEVLISQKLIKAPFSGRLGIRNVNIGQYVSPGTGLVNLQTMNPLLVQFSLPEQNLKSLYIGQPIHFHVDTFPGETFVGKITATEASVNTQTRNIQVEATVPNDKLRLYPGLYANIEVLLPTQTKVVTVPQTAVSYSLFGDVVYVVKQTDTQKDGTPIYTAHIVYVTTGDRRGNEVAILSNLKAGEQVVNSGQLKLQDGSVVKINNSVTMPSLSKDQLKQTRS